jgi:hypothetical protein
MIADFLGVRCNKTAASKHRNLAAHPYYISTNHALQDNFDGAQHADCSLIVVFDPTLHALHPPCTDEANVDNAQHALCSLVAVFHHTLHALHASDAVLLTHLAPAAAAEHPSPSAWPARRPAAGAAACAQQPGSPPCLQLGQAAAAPLLHMLDRLPIHDGGGQHRQQQEQRFLDQLLSEF